MTRLRRTNKKLSKELKTQLQTATTTLPNPRIAAECIGAIEGGDPYVSENVRSIVRARIIQRYREGRL
jgi:hypothetical protein